MKDSTRILREEMRRDIDKIKYHNNSKMRKRTNEQNEQHRRDKYNFYLKKWTDLKQSAETPAQIEYCDNVLGRLQHIR